VSEENLEKLKKKKSVAPAGK